ncbi:hypothetical protein CPIN18021_0239 [Campylobacter pinnipediorum subsp. caledonicus]|uniref:Phage protein n=1 Tax=Campylobacter pinnipediorum subsp. caledonicus TaxID=1874362 RepID=A0A1S6U5S0_9BACT|nr:hypothetical protein [Campylobacter pinnipediorum]AQW87086.1 hypothetical protein CPIN18021_0239 [Campylobacter pinnipediorum subsp. caledonicus]
MAIDPVLFLRFAKDIEPEIFQDKTPQIHFKILKFIDGDSMYKAVAVFRGAGKTTLLNKVCILSRIYFYKEPFIMIVSSNEEKAINFLEAVKGTIDRASQRGYAITRGKVWNKNRISVVVNAGLKDKNGNSIEATCHIITISAGQDPRGANIDNMRPTLIIVDDLESKVGQYTIQSKSNRQKLRSWFYADLLPAMHPKIGKVIIIGTILHDDSILNNIINPKNDELDTGIKWQTLKIPIIENGKSAWNSRFPIETIQKIKGTLEKQGMSNEFYQEYMCAAIDPEKAIFKKEFFKYFKKVEYDYTSPLFRVLVKDGLNQKELKVAKAKNIILADGTSKDLNKMHCYTTVDLASATGQDQTAMVTFCIDELNNIYIIDISAGHWTPFEKSVEIIRIFNTFSPIRIGIEKAGMQNDFFYTIDVIQKITGVSLPIEPLSHGGKAKNIRISNLEPYYRVGQILHNGNLAQTGELEAQLIAFDPEVESKQDDLMDAEAYLLQYLGGRTFTERQSIEDVEYYEYEESWY